jgi:hypothetical protein
MTKRKTLALLGATALAAVLFVAVVPATSQAAVPEFGNAFAKAPLSIKAKEVNIALRANASPTALKNVDLKQAGMKSITVADTGKVVLNDFDLPIAKLPVALIVADSASMSGGKLQVQKTFPPRNLADSKAFKMSSIARFAGASHLTA